MRRLLVIAILLLATLAQAGEFSTPDQKIRDGLVKSLASQNFMFAGPTGGTGRPTFRLIVPGDIANALTTPGPIGGTTSSTGQFTNVCVGPSPCTLDGTTGNVDVDNGLQLNDPSGGVHNTWKSVLLIDGLHNLQLGDGVTGKGEWGSGTDFESADGTGADWELTRSVLGGGNPGVSFGTVNVAPDTGIERTGVAALKVTGSVAIAGYVKGQTAAAISGGGALSTGSNSFAGTITGLAATGNVLTPGFTCANAVVAAFEDDTTAGGVKITARTTTTVTFSATLSDTADYIASCR